MRTLLIYAPDIHMGDAVGNYCFGLAHVAQRLGFNVMLFAQRFTTDQNVIFSAEDIPRMVNPDDILFVSYSIYDSKLDDLMLLQCKRICYFHGVTPPELLEVFEPVTAELCRKSFAQLSLFDGFDEIIANSQQSARCLQQAGITLEIAVIPPVFKDMALFCYPKGKLEKNRDKKTLLCVGRVVPHKRIEDVITLFAQVQQELGTDYRLTVVGNMPNFEYSKFLINYARSLGVLDFITFTGMIEESDLYDCYMDADALVSMSDHEGFCVPILEAMYFGMPAFYRMGIAADEFIVTPCKSSNNISNLAYSMVRYFVMPMHDSLLSERALEIISRTDDRCYRQLFKLNSDSISK